MEKIITKFKGKKKGTNEWVTGNFFYWMKHKKKIPIIGEGIKKRQCLW
jgi:hypothetical protein